MLTALVCALVVLPIGALASWAFAKPRSVAGRWIRRAWWWLFVRTSQERDDAISKRLEEIDSTLNAKVEAVHGQMVQRLETVELAVARISAELAQRLCDE